MPDCQLIDKRQLIVYGMVGQIRKILNGPPVLEKEDT